MVINLFYAAKLIPEIFLVKFLEASCMKCRDLSTKCSKRQNELLFYPFALAVGASHRVLFRQYFVRIRT